jgi:alkaline phosphatase
MIEGAHIDKYAHSNISDKVTEALKEFVNTIEAVLEYAKADGETLVVVTADHETGGITLKDGEYKFTKDGHSNADVPLFVYGSDKIIAKGQKINNYEIPMRIAYTLGFTEEDFPVAVIM